MGNKRKSPRQIAFLIRADVFRLARYLHVEHGEVLPVDIWGPVMAAILNRAERGPCCIGKKPKTWPGLDALSLTSDLRKYEIEPTKEDLDWLIGGAVKRGRKIGPAEIGIALKLDAETRHKLGIRNIFAVDEGAAERKERAKQKKTERDRARWKERRDVYLAKALTNTRPWENKGISRRTWFRREKLRAQSPVEDNSRTGREDVSALVCGPLRGASERTPAGAGARTAKIVGKAGRRGA